jgi:hypothetical protein
MVVFPLCPTTILLYKSSYHYRFWVLFNTLAESEKEEINRLGKIMVRERIRRFTRAKLFSMAPIEVKIEPSFFEPPVQIDSQTLNRELFEEIKKEYILDWWEREQGYCPFCRVNSGIGENGNTKFMRILSTKYSDYFHHGETIEHPEGRIENGGVLVRGCVCQNL